MAILLLRLFGLMRLKDLAKRGTLFSYLYSYILSANGGYIGKTAVFATPPNLPHGIKGVFISGGANIGANVTIFHSVTIGSNTLIDSSGRGAPTIGENCYIGVGAKLIGNIKIGENCRIGADAVVVDDVPDNSLVVGNKSAVVAPKIPMDNTYYLRSGGNWAKLVNGKVILEDDPEKLSKLNNSRSHSGE